MFRPSPARYVLAAVLVALPLLPALAFADEAKPVPASPLDGGVTHLPAQGMAALDTAPTWAKEMLGDTKDLDDAQPLSVKDTAIIGATSMAVGGAMWGGLAMLHEKAPFLAKRLDKVAPIAVPLATMVATVRASEALGVKKSYRKLALANAAAQVGWSTYWVQRANAEKSWDKAETKAALIATPAVGAAAEVGISHLSHADQEKLEGERETARVAAPVLALNEL
jgi:hypothetical protein